MRYSISFFVLAPFAVMLACSGDSSSSSDGGPDATNDVADASTETGYPAFAVDMPQIAKNQGAVLSAPVIATITWATDTNEPTWEAFDDAIGASSYWNATTSEYGVGVATSGANNHVRMQQPLASTLSYDDLQSYIIAKLQAADLDGGVDASGDGGAPDPTWPAPTLDGQNNAQTIYSLFVPSNVDVTDPGSGMGFCEEGGLGYHDDVLIGGRPTPYTVTLECSSQTLAQIEETAAHEAVEAATNPYPESTSTLGYVHFDPAHLAWDLFTGYNDELADACQNWQDSYYQETGNFPYWVQRSWSNHAALLGHDPCAPAPSGPYHGMTLMPSEESPVTVNLSVIGGGNATTQGFPVTVGQPLTFHVGFYSDAPDDAWTISYEFPADLQLSDMFNPVGNGAATVLLDTTSGQNGDVVTVTVTPTKKGPAGFQLMAITWDAPSSNAYLPHYLPVLLVDQ